VPDPQGLAQLWHFYSAEGDHSLRKTLQIAHTAVNDAAVAELDQVGVALTDSAIAAWAPPEQH